jgi:hypothetical protein
VAPGGPASAAILQMLAAAEALQDDPKGAAARLMEIAEMTDVAPVYRQIATLKAAMIPDSGIDADVRRARLDDLALGGGVIRLLAEEQLAYLDIEAGSEAAAIERLNAISADAEATAGLRRRATQVIVALGGEPVLPGGTAASAPDEATAEGADAEAPTDANASE